MFTLKRKAIITYPMPGKMDDLGTEIVDRSLMSALPVGCPHIFAALIHS